MPTEPDPRRAGPALSRGAWLLILLAALVPRAFRIEDVGEGVDEAYSVTTTRVMAEGRFTWREMNDYRYDAYAAKFQPVPEAVAVPFLRLLGDRPLAYRLPWLLASLALLALLLRHASLRHGRSAALVLAALYALDYRNVYYAQTHRYVMALGLFSFAALALAERAIASRRAWAWGATVLSCLFLLHSHLMGAWAILGLFAATLVRPAGAPGADRSWGAAALFGALLLYAAVMMRLLMAQAGRHAYLPGDETLLEAMLRSGGTTLRMMGGLGPVVAPLALVGSVMLARSPRYAERAAALGCLLTFTLWLVAGVFTNLAPRYGVAIQPFAFLTAAFAGSRLLERLSARPRARAALLGLFLLPSAAVTGWYLGTGGVRDAEAPIHEALRARARAGEAVLYLVPQEDPFHRRPTDYPAVPPSTADDADAVRRLDEAGLRWLVLSSATLVPEALAAPGFRARLEEVASVSRSGLFQPPLTLTLYRVRP